jgi:hypothetical protein
MNIKEIIEDLDNLIAIREQIKTFADEELITFYRHSTGDWRGEMKWTTWKVMLDESKSMTCVRDRRGFHVLNKQLYTQTVIAPAGTKDLILAKSKGDQIVGESILNNLAEKKYKK